MPQPKVAIAKVFRLKCSCEIQLLSAGIAHHRSRNSSHRSCASRPRCARPSRRSRASLSRCRSLARNARGRLAFRAARRAFTLGRACGVRSFTCSWRDCGSGGTFDSRHGARHRPKCAYPQRDHRVCHSPFLARCGGVGRGLRCISRRRAWRGNASRQRALRRGICPRQHGSARSWNAHRYCVHQCIAASMGPVRGRCGGCCLSCLVRKTQTPGGTTTAIVSENRTPNTNELSSC